MSEPLSSPKDAAWYSSSTAALPSYVSTTRRVVSSSVSLASLSRHAAFLARAACSRSPVSAVQLEPIQQHPKDRVRTKLQRMENNALDRRRHSLIDTISSFGMCTWTCMRMNNLQTRFSPTPNVSSYYSEKWSKSVLFRATSLSPYVVLWALIDQITHQFYSIRQRVKTDSRV